MLGGLLRRLLPGSAEQPKAAPRDGGLPWYLRSEQELSPERIEAARQRLKENIAPPEGEEA